MAEAANKAKAESEEEEAAGILTVNSEMAAGEIEEKLGGDATKVSEDKIAVEGVVLFFKATFLYRHHVLYRPIHMLIRHL